MASTVTNPTPLVKRSGETKLYTEDFGKQPEITGGDTLFSVISVVADIEPNPNGVAVDLVVSSITVNAARTGAQFLLSGGSNGNRYRLTVTVFTTGGSTLVGVSYLDVSDV